MKTFILTIITVISFTATSCNSDDNNDNEPIIEQPENHPIVGRWNLIKYTHFSSYWNYEPGEIAWEFTNENMFTVMINIPEEEASYPYNTSQTNEYNIEEDSIALFRQIDGENYQYFGVKWYKIEADTLEIYGELYLDDPYYKFVRE